MPSQHTGKGTKRVAEPAEQSAKRVRVARSTGNNMQQSSYTVSGIDLIVDSASKQPCRR